MIFLSLRMPYVKRKILPSGPANISISPFHALPTQHTDNKYQRLKNNNHQKRQVSNKHHNHRYNYTGRNPPHRQTLFEPQTVYHPEVENHLLGSNIIIHSKHGSSRRLLHGSKIRKAVVVLYIIYIASSPRPNNERQNPRECKTMPTTSSHFINSLAGKSALFVNTCACGVASSKRVTAA